MPLDYRAGRPGVYHIKRVRGLRTESKDAERRLWSILRGRQLAGAKFRRQHQFGPYVLDFYCAEHHLAIEADGGQHFMPDGLAHDEVRTRYLQSHGIRVLRLADNEILTNPEGVATRIAEAIKGQPSPVLTRLRRASAGLSQGERRDSAFSSPSATKMPQEVQ